MPRTKGTPTLLTRPSPTTGRPLAYAKFDRRTVSFGPAGPDATAAFDRMLAQWIANGRRFVEADDGGHSVADVVAAFLVHAEPIYSADAFENLKRAVDPVLHDFAQLPAEEFGVSCLEKIQNDLANVERQRVRKRRTKASKAAPAAGDAPTGAVAKPEPTYFLTRATIRARINAIRRCWRWAEQRRMVSRGTWEHLRTLEHVRPGRTKARESRIVEAVPWEWVEPVLPHLSTPLRMAVLLQWHSGMRSGEVCTLTGAQLDRSSEVWIYRPRQHKGVWKGRERTIRFGPKAKEILQGLLKLDPNAALVSPRDAIAEQKAEKARRRKTKVQPSQLKRAEEHAANPKLDVAEFYDANTYRRAVHRACQRADVPTWSPHMLRHACAARLFEAGEFEAARCVLGHSRLDMTRHYAQSAEARLAADAMKRHG